MADITDFTHGDDWDREEGKSKTQIKKEMLALQELGEELVSLSASNRAKLPLDEELINALQLADKLSKKHEALRRHIQFIGRLMRTRDLEPLERGLAIIRNTNQAATRKFHLVEDWRDKLIASNDALTEFVAEYPDVDVQQLRSLADIVQVQRALAQVVGVSQVTVKRYQQETAQFAVQTNISAEGLINALRFNKQLLAIPGDTEQPLSVDSSPVLATYRYRGL